MSLGVNFVETPFDDALVGGRSGSLFVDSLNFDLLFNVTELRNSGFKFLGIYIELSALPSFESILSRYSFIDEYRDYTCKRLERNDYHYKSFHVLKSYDPEVPKISIEIAKEKVGRYFLDSAVDQNRLSRRNTDWLYSYIAENNEKKFAFTIRNDSVCIGLAMLSKNQFNMNIDFNFLFQEFRGNGYGKYMLDCIRQFAREQGCAP